MKFRRSPAKSPGAALVIVIVLVTMLMVLIMAFFSLARLERRASSAYADMALVKALESSATQLAIGQLRDATSHLDDDETWVSQPGMIRVFDGTGKEDRAYKLYSSASMVVGGGFEPGSDRPPGNWEGDPAMWVDLNASAIESTGGGEEDEFKVYPIVDPRLEADGFSIGEAPGATADQEAPMPVRWLYVLRDGTVVPPQGGSGGSVRVVGATSDNAIVGRVAFWADDETCKLNINTASEPTPWDTPRCVSLDDFNYGSSQPYQGEFQRYPGHPSMTALSPVLFPGRKSIRSSEKEAIYQLLPRVAEGGTRSGTVPYSNSRRNQPTADDDRLFASVDELIFDPRRRPVRSRLVDPDVLRRSRFLLTAHSRAPEVNLFGLPRMSIWPVHRVRGPRFRSPFDDLSVFCSTIGGKEFHFQRFDSSSARVDGAFDRNRRLYDYIVELTSEPVPGFGASLASRWGEDHEQVITEVFDYIRCANLRDSTLPEQGRFVGRNGQATPMIIGDTMGFGRIHTINEAGLHFVCAGDGDDPLYERLRQPNGRLQSGERLIETALLLEPFSAAHGYIGLSSLGVTGRGEQRQQLRFDFSGLNSFQLEGQPMFRSDRVSYTPATPFGTWGFYHGRGWGGPQGVRTWIAGGSYPLIGRRLKIGSVQDGGTLSFSGGTVTVTIFSLGEGRSNERVQTLTIEFPPGNFPVPKLVQEGTDPYDGAGATAERHWWTLASRYSTVNRHPHAPGPEYVLRRRQWPVENGRPPGFKAGGVFRQEDVVRTVAVYHGDHRLVAARQQVPAGLFKPNHFYDDPRHMVDHTFAPAGGTHFFFGFGNEPGVTYIDGRKRRVTLPKGPGTQLTDVDYHYARLPDVPVGAGKLNLWGDFDNGIAHMSDGAYINKPDDGNVSSTSSDFTQAYWAWNFDDPEAVIFSPNRLMPSPGMFGSLPTGVKRDRPWQTLLFRPQDGHPGAMNPPDHLLLDLFWMPVIEPYAISEPFSTAGKINLNYRIEPFNWITRRTGLHGIFKSERPAAIPNRYSVGYKLWDHETSDLPRMPDDSNSNLDFSRSGRQWITLKTRRDLVRRDIDAEATLEQFEERFDDGKLFKSASEICEIHLVRENESLAAYRDGSFWAEHVLTGDNTRERPYTNIYGRLTTRSNVFRLHFRVQLLDGGASRPGEFNPATGRVAAESRGSVLIERHVDPNDPELPDFAAAGVEERVEDHYRYRLLERREFAP